MLNTESQEWLRDALLVGQRCRSELARGLCEIDDWVNPKSIPCAASARAALADQLEVALSPSLPQWHPYEAGPFHGESQGPAGGELCSSQWNGLQEELYDPIHPPFGAQAIPAARRL